MEKSETQHLRGLFLKTESIPSLFHGVCVLLKHFIFHIGISGGWSVSSDSEFPLLLSNCVTTVKLF